MESFRDNNLGFYVLVYKLKGEIWICAKDICLSLGYNDYKRAVQNHVNKEDKKKPKLQDKRYLCYFLNKSGVYFIIIKSRKTKVKNQFIELLEDVDYSNKPLSIIRVYKKDHEAPKKFKTNPYKSRNYKRKTEEELSEEDIEIIKEATKEALEAVA